MATLSTCKKVILYFLKNQNMRCPANQLVMTAWISAKILVVQCSYFKESHF